MGAEMAGSPVGKWGATKAETQLDSQSKLLQHPATPPALPSSSHSEFLYSPAKYYIA